MDLSNKVFTVTGAASGIGRATTIKLASLGASAIAIGDVNEAGLKETKYLCSKYGTKITTRFLDVRKPEQVQKWIDDTVHEFGQLDGCANIAGIAGGNSNTTVETMEMDLWARTMKVNVDGVLFCMRSQLGKLKKPGGSIVNIASTGGIRGMPNSAAYSTSKHAVIGLSASATKEYGRQGIRINTVLPGPIDTPIFRDGEKDGLFNGPILTEMTALGRVGQPGEIANVVCFMLSDEASYVSGAQWVVDGGLTA